MKKEPDFRHHPTLTLPTLTRKINKKHSLHTVFAASGGKKAALRAAQYRRCAAAAAQCALRALMPRCARLFLLFFFSLYEKKAGGDSVLVKGKSAQLSATGVPCCQR